MLASVLFPFDAVQPSEILSQYSDWIYFTVVFIFFVSITGITLKKHFSKSYLKPLIFSVALLFTIGVFKYKESLKSIFEGWGILGALLLVFITAIIPYGLCRGFGMPAKKAFYLTYILFYVLSWVKFPELYHGLANRNLGLVNLALLILCFFSAYKIIRFGKSPRQMAKDLTDINPFKTDIEHEIDNQNKEKRAIKHQAKKITAIEIHSIEDIASELAEIQKIVEAVKNSISSEERQRIAQMLREISSRENIFKKATPELMRIFRRLVVMDLRELQDLKQRFERVSGKEKHVLKKEMDREKEKIRIEKVINDFQEKIDQYLYSFNESLGSAMEKIEGTGYPYDSLPHIVRARLTLKDLSTMLDKMKALENRLIHLIHSEKKLLRKESKTG